MILFLIFQILVLCATSSEKFSLKKKFHLTHNTVKIELHEKIVSVLRICSVTDELERRTDLLQIGRMGIGLHYVERRK